MRLGLTAFFKTYTCSKLGLHSASTFDTQNFKLVSRALPLENGKGKDRLTV